MKKKTLPVKAKSHDGLDFLLETSQLGRLTQTDELRPSTTHRSIPEHRSLTTTTTTQYLSPLHTTNRPSEVKNEGMTERITHKRLYQLLACVQDAQ